MNEFDKLFWNAVFKLMFELKVWYLLFYPEGWDTFFITHNYVFTHTQKVIE